MKRTDTGCSALTDSGCAILDKRPFLKKEVDFEVEVSRIIEELKKDPVLFERLKKTAKEYSQIIYPQSEYRII